MKTIFTIVTVFCVTLFIAGIFLPFSAFASVSSFVFTSLNQLELGSRQTITIQSQNGFGEKENTVQTTCLEIRVTSLSGKLFSSANSTDPVSVLILTMNKNSANRNFYYEENQAGSYIFNLKAAYRPEDEKRTCSNWPVEEWGNFWVANQNYRVGNESGGEQEETQVNSPSSPAVSYVKSTSLIPNIFADAGDDRTVIVGADSFFDGKSFGVEKKPLENAEYIWNFGDGSVKKGQKVMYSYNYPGEYIVFLDVASGEYSSSDRIKVVVVSADLIVSNVVYGKDGFVELYNKTNRELDISWWRIQVGSNFFTIPKNTIILGGKKIIFSYKTTKIEANYDNPIKLLYPNGSIANIYNLPTIIESAPISNKTNDSAVLSNNLTKNESSIINTESSKASAAGGFPKNSAPPVSNEKEENTVSAVNSMEQSGSEERGKIYKWIFALAGIIFLSTIGVIFSKKTKTDVQQISDQIKIIE